MSVQTMLLKVHGNIELKSMKYERQVNNLNDTMFAALLCYFFSISNCTPTMHYKNTMSLTDRNAKECISMVRHALKNPLTYYGG